MLIQRCSILFLCLFPLLGGGVAAGRDLSDFTVGFNTHGIFKRDLPALQDLGYPSCRLDVRWQDVADDHGVVQPEHPMFAGIRAQRGLGSHIAILCYGHSFFENGLRPTTPRSIEAFGRYADQVVAGTAPEVQLFEVWNEWNGQHMPGGAEGETDPAAYVALLRNTRQAMGRIDPRGRVLGGSVSDGGIRDGWLQRAIECGLLENCDAVSVHPYLYAETGDNRLPEVGLNKQLATLDRLLKGHEKAARIPVYITELGWPTYNGRGGVSLDDQAKFLARSVLISALDSRVNGLWIYELRDGAGPIEKEKHFGLTFADGSPKPALGVLRDLLQLLSEARSIEVVDNDSRGSAMTLKCELRTGGETWLCWTLQPGRTAFLEWNNATSHEPLTARVLGSESALPVGRGSSAESLRLEIRDMPVVVRSLPKGARLALVPVSR